MKLKGWKESAFTILPFCGSYTIYELLTQIIIIIIIIIIGVYKGARYMGYNP